MSDQVGDMIISSFEYRGRTVTMVKLGCIASYYELDGVYLSNEYKLDAYIDSQELEARADEFEYIYDEERYDPETNTDSAEG